MTRRRQRRARARAMRSTSSTSTSAGRVVVAWPSCCDPLVAYGRRLDHRRRVAYVLHDVACLAPLDRRPTLGPVTLAAGDLVDVRP
jgi:hypothetical protein